MVTVAVMVWFGFVWFGGSDGSCWWLINDDGDDHDDDGDDGDDDDDGGGGDDDDDDMMTWWHDDMMLLLVLMMMVLLVVVVIMMTDDGNHSQSQNVWGEYMDEDGEKGNLARKAAPRGPGKPVTQLRVMLRHGDTDGDGNKFGLLAKYIIKRGVFNA